MRPELFHIPFPWAEKGYIPIFSYGFMIMLGFIFAILYGAWRARREGEDPNHVLDIGIFAVVSGILGARVFYYVEFYQEHFANRSIGALFAIWEGGIVFYGGFLAATAVVLAYLRLHKLHVLKFADILACTIPLGLSFGRVGCYLNGCCWGRIDGSGWGLDIQFPRGSPAWDSHVHHYNLPETAAQSLPVHATQLYEWAMALILVALLFLYYRAHTRHGQVFAMLFVLYGPVRYVIEGLREQAPAERMIGHPWLWDPIAADFMTKSQVVSVGILLGGLAFFLWATLRGESYRPKG